MLDDASAPAVFAGIGTTIQMIRGVLRSVARSRANVLLHGEPGTGKFPCAASLQAQGRTDAAPLSMVPLGGLGEDEAEQCLFEAIARASSAVSLDSRTVYLEAIESLSRRLQRRLESTLCRGDERPIRVLSSSVASLADQVRLGLFSPALYRRLSVVELRLAPLRSRREDIPAIVDACLRRWERRGGTRVPVLSPAALGVFRRYDWPGNVLELERIVEVLCATVAEQEVSAGHVRRLLRKLPPSAHAMPHLVPLQQAKRDWIVSALERSSWNRADAARRLRISRNTLVRTLKTPPRDCGIAP